MRERPILLKAIEVKMILTGWPTRIRRPLADQALGPQLRRQEALLSRAAAHGLGDGSHQFKSPYGYRGDRLWVRETWQKFTRAGKPFYVYAASTPGDVFEFEHPKTGLTHQKKVAQWRSSTHMKRAACRIVLEITNVALERIQETSIDDAILAGANWPFQPESEGGLQETRRLLRQLDFPRLWNRQHGEGSYERNDWVWVISVRRVQ